MAGFPGFTPEALKFLKALKKNNNREWFQPRKEEYERLWRTPMIQMVTALQSEAAKFAPDYAHQDPAKSVMRIYRDTRFSKDKTPYKTYVAAGLRRTGLDKEGGGFYFHIGEEGLLIAGGVYAPMPDELRAIRQHLTEHHGKWRKQVTSSKFKSQVGELQGEALTRVPKGVDPDHPAADLLKQKQFFFSVTLPIELVTTPAVHTELVKRFKTMAPAVEFLNIPLIGLAKGKDNRFLNDFA
jgi:uncharacterized protein (TIGR02453 family)